MFRAHSSVNWQLAGAERNRPLPKGKPDHSRIAREVSPSWRRWLQPPGAFLGSPGREETRTPVPFRDSSTEMERAVGL
jgi:hypothetical protein